MALLKHLLFLCLLLWVVSAQRCSKDSEGVEITSCNRCLWRSDCKWCTTISGKEGLAIGCVEKGYQCNDKVVESKNDDNVNVSDTEINTDSSKGLIEQISPQEVTLKVVPDQATKVDFKVKVADIPVDLYFVLDSSLSMKKYTTSLANAASDITAEIQKLTRDYRLGFGSFIEKPRIPFTKGKTSGAYAFHHIMNLTKNSANEFEGKVTDLIKTFQKNIDVPEAGLDAIAQTMLCPEIIGWQEEGRKKIIIMMADAEMHFALDGILGGITDKFPMDKCLLDNGGYDSKQNDYDYPSFGQIRELSQKTKTQFILIAAAQSKYGGMRKWYKKISMFVQGTDNSVWLTKSTNFGKSISKEYKKLKSTVKVTHSTSQNIDLKKVELESDCKAPKEQDNVHICLNVEEAKTLNFKADITVDKNFCIKDMTTTVDFKLEGTENKMVLNINCEKCNCNATEVNSEKCNKKGDLICGGCQCHKGFSGKQCECGGNSSSSQKVNKECEDKSNKCNGNGKCKCGKCECTQDYVGEFCLCDHEECPGLKDGKPICSDHGKCNKCNAKKVPGCTCDDGWSGYDCSCPTSEENCKDALYGKVCSGNGKCKCGICECESEEFSGKFCQKKENSICEAMGPCIMGKIEHSNNKKSSSEVDTICTDSFDKNKFGKDIYNLCHKKVLQGTYYIYVNDIENCRKHDDATNASYSGLQDCFDMVERVAEDPSILGRACRMHNNPPSCDYERSDEDRGCQVKVYHSELDSDDYFEKKKKTDISFIIYREPEKEGEIDWIPNWTCGDFPVMELIAASAGVFLAIVIGAVVTIVVLVNLRDLREWKQHLADREVTKMMMSKTTDNRMYQSNTTSYAIPKEEISPL